MRDRRLLVVGVVLVTAGLVGMSVAGGWGGWWSGMHHGPMMGWFGGEPATRSNPAISGAPTLVVEAVDFAFELNRVEVATDQEFNLTLVNQGALLHDLTIPDLGIRVVARPGESTTVGVTAQPPGEYLMLCTVPGHAEAGMEGWLVVHV